MIWGRWVTGVPKMIPLVAIVGRPNVGKSHLAALLGSEKQLCSILLELRVTGITAKPYSVNAGLASWTGGFNPSLMKSSPLRCVVKRLRQ